MSDVGLLLDRLRETLEGRAAELRSAAEERSLLALAEDLGRRADDNLRALVSWERAEGLALWLRLRAAADELALTLRARSQEDARSTLLARRAEAATTRLAAASVADALRERS